MPKDHHNRTPSKTPAAAVPQEEVKQPKKHPVAEGSSARRDAGGSIDEIPTFKLNLFGIKIQDMEAKDRTLRFDYRDEQFFLIVDHVDETLPRRKYQSFFKDISRIELTVVHHMS